MPSQRSPRMPAGSREPGRGGAENHVPETDEGHRGSDACRAAWAPAVAWARASGEHLAPARCGSACHCRPWQARGDRPGRGRHRGRVARSGQLSGHAGTFRGPGPPGMFIEAATFIGMANARGARRAGTRSAAGRSGANGSPVRLHVGADDTPAPLAGYCPLNESQRGPRLECGSDRELQTWRRRACRTALRFVGAPPLRPPVAGPAPAAPCPCYGQAIAAASLGASSRRAIGSKK